MPSTSLVVTALCVLLAGCAGPPSKPADMTLATQNPTPEASAVQEVWDDANASEIVYTQRQTHKIEFKGNTGVAACVGASLNASSGGCLGLGQQASSNAKHRFQVGPLVEHLNLSLETTPPGKPLHVRVFASPEGSAGAPTGATHRLRIIYSQTANTPFEVRLLDQSLLTDESFFEITITQGNSTAHPLYVAVGPGYDFSVDGDAVFMKEAKRRPSSG